MHKAGLFHLHNVVAVLAEKTTTEMPPSAMNIEIPINENVSSRRLRKAYCMTEICRLALKGFTHQEIMEKLRLPERTYFRYLSETFLAFRYTQKD
jgi:hypothetical protein